MAGTDKAYAKLARRINRFPQGAPPTELLYKILAILFNSKEAELVSLLPLRPFGAAKAADIWKMNIAEARNILDNLAGRGLLVDIQLETGGWVYVMPPPMAGFFEFSLMRVRQDIDQKALSELFYQYINEQPEFVEALFLTGSTSIARVFVHEPALETVNGTEILDYERASEVIRTASHIAVGLCYCRHKMMHAGRACSAPLSICMTFNNAAAAVIRHAMARQVEIAECLDLLNQAYESNLVQGGENVRQKVSFICNCCACCCEGLIVARKFGRLHPVQTTNYLPEIETSACSGCGKCVKACPVEALQLVSANDPHKPTLKKAHLDDSICLGCGVCTRVCPSRAIRLKARPQRVITPADSLHRTVLMAIERGQLQNLIFDNQVLTSQRAMAAVLGAILRLPPIKQIMASRQLQSRYLEALINRLIDFFDPGDSWLGQMRSEKDPRDHGRIPQNN